MGIALVKGEQFDKASARLEEVWEQDQSDPTVAEYLAVAYLNTEDRRMLPDYQKRAFEIIEKLASSNQKVTFLVQHSHEKMGWLQGRELNQYCRGYISITEHRMVYVSEKGEKAAQHSFEIGPESFKAITVNETDSRGTFQLKTTLGHYFFATRNRNREEARRLADLIQRQLAH